MTGIVAEGRDPATVTVAEVMARDVATVTFEASSQHAEALLRVKSRVVCSSDSW